MPLTPQVVFSRADYKKPIFAMYDWKSDLSDGEILEKLLALNLERANPDDH